jgi:glyoxylase-like metal-dependent hydrolase (beta-lactamase superfamily II)
VSGPTPIARVLANVGAEVFERGWLSSNNVLFRAAGDNALIDSGYATHADQTLAWVERALDGAPLNRVLNTHLHSDHCGGNAALKARYPALQTLIPPGQAQAVSVWDEDCLTYRPTGQECPRFQHDGLLQPGHSVRLGPLTWEVHAAQGHDPHAIVLHQPAHRLLISADALWENGFGVVFPELEGDSAFDEVADTLDLIERLAPTTVIPGHGPVFQDLAKALGRARTRLEQFQSAPDKHRRYAMKVLIKFRLLAWQRMERSAMLQWAKATPYLAQVMPETPAETSAWFDELLNELARAQALDIQSNWIINR